MICGYASGFVVWEKEKKDYPMFHEVMTKNSVDRKMVLLCVVKINKTYSFGLASLHSVVPQLIAISISFSSTLLLTR